MEKRTLKQVLSDALRILYSDIKSAKWAIGFVIAYFVIFRHGLMYTICPMVLITGFPCPGCGMTRAGFALLRFDFAAAFKIHPYIYPIAVLIGVFCLQRYILVKKDMHILRNCAIVVLFSMILFWVWRMYRYFPNVSPMTYYGGNLLAKVMHLLHLAG